MQHTEEITDEVDCPIYLSRIFAETCFDRKNSLLKVWELANVNSMTASRYDLPQYHLMEIPVSVALSRS